MFWNMKHFLRVNVTFYEAVNMIYDVMIYDVGVRITKLNKSDVER